MPNYQSFETIPLTAACRDCGSAGRRPAAGYWRGLGFWVGVSLFLISQIPLVAFFLGHFVWPQ